MAKINKLHQIIKQVYKLNMGNLIGRTTADYLTKNMNCYWPKYTLIGMSMSNSVLSEGCVKIIKEKE